MPGEELRWWLHSLPSDVLRIKGVVRLAEKPDQWLHFNRLNGSNREIRFHDLEEQPSIPPCAVLIGVDLDEAAIRELLVGRGQEQDHSKPQ